MTENEKQLLAAGAMLPLMEQFYTLQGEGAHSGKAAYFIRVGGCDVGCHWCDVKESWNPDLHPLTAIEAIVAPALAVPARTMVITGGEPSLYDLRPLTSTLVSHGFTVHIETSGAYLLQGTFHWICLSPKKTAPPLPAACAMANELKIIVYNANDLLWAEQHAALVPENCELFLQPEWSKRETMMPLIVDYVQRNPQWRISLQSHKYMNIP